MNGTRITTSSICGIVLSNNRDCRGWVNPDLSLNLCAMHIEEAYELHQKVRDAANTARECLKCPVCDELEFRSGTTGMMCAFCAYRTEDFTGTYVKTFSEVKQSQDARKEAQRASDSTDVVYYILFRDRVKIGTSSNLRKRLSGLPFDKVLGVERGDRSAEARRHKQFAHLRVKGEWFENAPELLEHAKNLNGPGQNWFQDPPKTVGIFK